MKDPKGNQISISDRVKVLWNFDNKIHSGEIATINDGFVNVNVNVSSGHMSIKDNKKITKIPDKL
ncbi:MAG: hypothetical protein HF976_02635 [ANME-2 cluster archaeon]|nr:hypothetical protein [ANME-2 cluster archaeon]MBC2700302.1 hypothetical protein [ANME-2 cluster archaeon]MBC2708530.1 hypothetical protein [ANME-2 cluster archaeon]MBC2747998.1 hypothetical protein [ANME-2 cluster archaeon]